MAKFNTDTLSLFHTFSKTQVNSDATKPQFSSLGNTVNKSGHTVQSNEIWTEAIPFFGLGVPADFSSTAQVNDLVKDADGVIWQRNATPYNGSTGTYWTQKTKSITSFTKGADGKYTFTEEDGALVDGSYLLNAAGVPTVKYHAKKQLTPLVSDNNAFIDSEKDASRLKIDGKWVDQFIGVTDVYVNGSAAVSYAPVLFSNSSSTTPLKAGAGEDYLDYCATGIILWDKNDCTGNEVISCFEYVGTKLDATVAALQAAVFGSDGPSGGEQPASLQQQVAQNTAAINTLNTTTIPAIQQSVTDAVTTANGYTDDKIAEELEDGGSIAEAIATAKQSAIDSAKVTLTAGTGITIPNSGTPQTSFTVSVNEAVIATKTFATGEATDKADAALASAKTYAEGQAATAKSEAISAANDYTDDEIVKAKAYADEKAGAVSDALNTAKGELTTAIGTAKNEAIAAAKTETESQVGTAKSELTAAIATAKDEAIAAAKTETETQVSALKKELTEGDTSLTGKVTTLEGKVSTLEGSVKTITETTIPAAEAAAKKHADDAVAGLKTELTTGVIKTAQDTADQAVKDAAAALAEAQKRISKVSEGTASDLLTVSTTGTEVTITLDGDVATKTHVAGEIKTVTEAATALTGRVTTAEGKINTLEETTVPAVKAIAEQGVADAATAAAAVTTLSDKAISSQSVTGAGVSVTLSGKVGAPTLTGSVTTASYTKASGETPGSWTNEANVATGTAVKNALADVASAHSKDIQTLQTAINGLTTTGLTREVLPNGQTTADITDPKANVIYLVKDSKSETGAYVEYLYVDGTFEAIGTTSTDLSEYAKTGGSTKTIADLATEVATAQGEVDALEVVVSTLSQTHASDKTALENSIKAVSDKVGTDSVATQIDTKLSALTDKTAQGGAGVTLTQTNGKVTLTVTSGVVAASGTTSADKFVKGETVHTAINSAIDTAVKALDKTSAANGITLTQTDGIAQLSVAPGSVAEGNTSVVTGGAVYTAIDTAVKAVSDLVGTKSVATQISEAIGALDSSQSGNGITVALTDGKVTSVSAAAGTVAEGNADVVTGGVVHTAVEAVKTLANTKISAVEVTTDATTHFGAQHITATTGDDKKVTITVTRADEWSVGTTKPASTITSVINGKMSDGKTIDDANLVNGTSMFAGNTALTTFVGDLGKLTTGTNMFSGCTGLTTFCGNLSSLTEGTGMFAGCALDEDSLIYIVDSLPELPTGTTATITVGVATSVINKAVYATEAQKKGWALA